MSKSNKILVGSLVLAGMTSVGIYAMASADEDGRFNRGRNYSPERHERMEKAFEKNDYNSWKEEMNKNEHRGRVTEVVNEGNFSKFAEMHKLREEGKDDEANKIREELGLGMRNGGGRMNGEGRHGDRHGERSERGENKGGHFIDNDHDGECDN